MAGPKHKVTRSKVKMRRSHHSAATLTGAKCSKCGELKLAHAVCKACGYYNDRQVIKGKKEV